MSEISGLYGIADSAFGDPERQFAVLADAGVTCIQLRCKGWTSERLLTMAQRCATRAASARCRLIINDDVAAARAVGAWVHLGQEDGETTWAHGRSTHSPAQISSRGAALYVGFGPIFATTTKATGYDARGLEMLTEAVRVSQVPVVAIGGITAENIDAVRGTGVAGWAVIGAIWGSADPVGAIARFR